MEPITWVLVASLIFGGWQYTRAESKQDEIEKLEYSVLELSGKLKQQQKDLDNLITIGNENADIADRINTAYQICIEDLSSFSDAKILFERYNQNNKERIKELESRLNSSNLTECRVPDWLVDEITGD